MRKALVVALCACISLHGKANKKAPPPPVQVSRGNLALPASQQPSPLVGFGQNIINKNDALAYIVAGYTKGFRSFSAEFSPLLLYGITDRSSVYGSIILTGEKDACQKEISAGGFVQGEYAVYNKTYPRATDQVTLVCALAHPTISTLKTRPSPVKTPSLFLGTTASRMGVEWYYFVAGGVQLSLPHHRVSPGAQWLYQGGICKNLGNPKGMICSLVCELNGFYFARDKICKKPDYYSGGHLLLLSPSLWLASKNFLVQAGFSVPIAQKVFDLADKDYWLITINMAWKFHG